jgi:hypothetical protein
MKKPIAFATGIITVLLWIEYDNYKKFEEIKKMYPKK